MRMQMSENHHLSNEIIREDTKCLKDSTQLSFHTAVYSTDQFLLHTEHLSITKRLEQPFFSSLVLRCLPDLTRHTPLIHLHL